MHFTELLFLLLLLLLCFCFRLDSFKFSLKGNYTVRNFMILSLGFALIKRCYPWFSWIYHWSQHCWWKNRNVRFILSHNVAYMVFKRKKLLGYFMFNRWLIDWLIDCLDWISSSVTALLSIVNSLSLKPYKHSFNFKCFQFLHILFLCIIYVI